MCDGVRCDMAMLVCPEVMRKTWPSERRVKIEGENDEEFWPSAIKAVKSKHPGFTFIAEVYWHMEQKLLLNGFDYCYDKNLYDALRHRNTADVRRMIHATVRQQRAFVRFIENHDEDRACHGFPDTDHHVASAVLCYLSVGLKFLHMGQLEGRSRKVHMQQGHFHEENLSHHRTEKAIGFYFHLTRRLLTHPSIRDGSMHPANTAPSSDGDDSHERIVAFFRMSVTDSKVVLVVVNFSSHHATGWVIAPKDVSDQILSSPLPHWKAKQLLFCDLIAAGAFQRDSNEVMRRGMWFSLKPFESHVLEVSCVCG
eukprot:Polyplicarium_translucidae@DN1747_c0_g1_i1.p1